MKAFILILVSLVVPVPALAGTWVDKPVVVVTGDSYTRRTSCTFNGSYDACDQTGQIKHHLSYATYLNSATKYQVVLSDNSARGGDTCTRQAAYENGIWVGHARGIVEQVNSRVKGGISDVVSILLGINDVNKYGVSEDGLKSCLRSLYYSVASSGRKVVAMTYPPVGAYTAIWGSNGNAASSNVAVVNSAIRKAVAEHNAQNSSLTVHLAETSSAWTLDSVPNLTEDGAHPNVDGAMRLAKTWYSEVCSKGYLNCY